MANTNINFASLSDARIIARIGDFVKHTRIQQNKTQEQLATASGLNRYTISKIENGESITLSSLIQILRSLQQLHLLENFHFIEQISPLEYAKLKKKQQKERVRNKSNNKEEKDLGW
ncbi:helix-turn-helix domain-containing protein [Polaribacter sp. M15]